MFKCKAGHDATRASSKVESDQFIEDADTEADKDSRVLAPIEEPPDAVSELHWNKSIHSKDIPALEPIEVSPDVLLMLHRHMSIHSKDIPALEAIEEPSDVLLGLHRCMSNDPKDIPAVEAIGQYLHVLPRQPWHM